MASSSKSNAKLANVHDDNVNLVIEEDDLSFGLQVLGSFSFPMALRSAIDLGIFEIIAKAGEGAKLSAKDIAIHIGTNSKEAPNMLDRLLRMLACHTVLNCSVHEDTQNIGPPQSLYSLSPRSKCFVNDADGVSLGPLLALALDKVFYQSWNELNGAIMEGGIPFNRIYGMNAFEYSSVDPRFNEVFNKAMFNSTLIMKKILQVYKGFEHINRLVDVGGGLGLNLKLITSKYPNVKGINFDLPHVIQNAPVYAGVEHVAGDMFESVPAGDAILMKWILHDWGDEQCMKLLKNCYKAIPDDGKVIVVDSILPIVPEATASAKFGFGSDLFMMTQNPGGKERTQQELMELATSSGFSGINLWILHDWSDEHCLKLLKNCYKAIPDDGKLIVVDSIIPIVPDTTAYAKNAFVFDLLMLTQIPGGKERTHQEIMELVTGSGFSCIKFICCVNGVWVMEFFK